MTSLDGRVAIVTGTSSGLGRRFAEVLDGAGARVVLASRRHQEDLELAARLRDALPVACDVRGPADRKALVQAAISRFGPIDIRVNNAGAAWRGTLGQRRPSANASTNCTCIAPGSGRVGWIKRCKACAT